MVNMNIDIIVAVDNKFGISKDGLIPWNFKEDMLYFLDVTKFCVGGKNAIIMGRYTWNAIPVMCKPLKDRISIVVSSSDIEVMRDTYVVRNLQEGVMLARKLCVKTLFIGGGVKMYDEACRTLVINNVYLTIIEKDYGCDNNINMDLMIDHLDNLVYSRIVRLVDHKSGEKCVVSFNKYGDVRYNVAEQRYLDMIYDILKNGDFRVTRNSNTWSVFSRKLEFDMRDGFPLLTSKRVFFRGIVEELLFFLKGDTNTNHLSDKGVNIWVPNTRRAFLDSVGLCDYEEGDMGAMYGFNWVHYGAEYCGMDSNYSGKGFNQIQYCLNLLKNDPHSRR